jgi:hypothetical protein
MQNTFAARFALAMLIGAGFVDAQNWAQTETETIWHTRYTNCDKGYFVDLPRAVVAHGTLPPNPNHGFLISAADPSTRLQVTYERGRIVFVWDEYNSMLMPNASAQIKWEIESNPGARLEGEKAIRFRGLTGVEATYRRLVDGKTQITHEVIAFRKADDLVYTVRLVTDPLNYAHDLELFKQIEAGFQIFPIPSGECVNP